MLKTVFFCCLILLFNQIIWADPLPIFIADKPFIEDSSLKNLEIDILIAQTNTDTLKNENLDIPQQFALIYQPQTNAGEGDKGERKDLLGDLEEIVFQNKKAWGANAALDKPGLYQFILETKPLWNEEKNSFFQQTAKIIIPFGKEIKNYNKAAGISFEIIPKTRPFGLVIPCLFNGQVIFNGKPLENATVIMGKFEDKEKNLESKTDAQGQFAFVLNQPGWWYCQANTPSAPLKGADGTMKNSELSAVLWVYAQERTKSK